MNKIFKFVVPIFVASSLLIPTTTNAYNTDVESVIIKEQNLKPSDFTSILYTQTSPRTYSSKSFTVNSLQDLVSAMREIDRELYSYAFFKSDVMTTKELKDFYKKYQSNIPGLINMNTLANYSVEGGNLLFVFKDNTDRSQLFSAKQYREAFNIFVDKLMEEVKGETDEETILNLYNWIYENYSYEASSGSSMRVSNLAKGKMACNGFSRLVAEVLHKLDIPVRIVRGNYHFWNLATIDGTTTTIDITTDIVLRKKYYTLGKSTLEHREKTGSVGFYDASFNGNNLTQAKDFNFAVSRLMY